MDPKFKPKFDKNKERRSYPGDGRWIIKPRRSEVLDCSICKGKYIKTRAGQKTCVRCLVKEREGKLTVR